MVTRSVTNILQEARALIETPKTWIRHAGARSSPRGPVVSATDPSAQCFCAIGAIAHVTGPMSMREPALAILRRALREIDGSQHLTHYNDRKGPKAKIHAEVLALFDAAIKLSKSRKRVSA